MHSNRGTGRPTGHQTTTDVVNQARYTTVALVGKKRSREEEACDLPPPPRPVSSAADLAVYRKDLVEPYAPEIQPITASKINYCQPKQLGDGLYEYTQRLRNITSTPTSTADPLLSLSHTRYDLPEHLVQNLANLGVRSIYPWQSKCLLGNGILSGEKNLVYTAPTGGGKSLVADILILKKIIENPTKKAILVLPYVALVQEKTRWLRAATAGVEKAARVQWPPLQPLEWRKPCDNASLRVVGFFGGNRCRESWSDFDIAVFTIEKVSSHRFDDGVRLTSV
jgi:hypothetical protein